MYYHEETKDLFTVNNQTTEPYCLAHCISADFAMAGGVVLGFNKYFNMKNRLIAKYGDKTQHFKDHGAFMLPETCYISQNPYYAFYVYNLVTKCTVRDKPTYAHLRNTLMDMRNHMEDLGLTKLAIPRIGCGIDGLDWEIVRGMIKKAFQKTNIEVLVCIK